VLYVTNHTASIVVKTIISSAKSAAMHTATSAKNTSIATLAMVVYARTARIPTSVVNAATNFVSNV
jgi:hypothetical protein